MKHTLNIFGKSVELDDNQMEKLRELLGIKPVRLAEIAEGETFTVGGREYIVLEHGGGDTAALLKEIYKSGVEFGKNNRYEGSAADEACLEFYKEISETVGAENIREFDLDLTSDDGLKDYGIIKRSAALLNTEMYRRYVDILDKFKLEKWQWLATPHSTKRHGNDSWVKCVSPSGFMYYGNVNYVYAVRPFCILNSNIFVSE